MRGITLSVKFTLHYHISTPISQINHYLVNLTNWLLTTIFQPLYHLPAIFDRALTDENHPNKIGNGKEES